MWKYTPVLPTPWGFVLVSKIGSYPVVQASLSLTSAGVSVSHHCISSKKNNTVAQAELELRSPSWPVTVFCS